MIMLIKYMYKIVANKPFPISGNGNDIWPQTIPLIYDKNKQTNNKKDQQMYALTIKHS